MFAAVLRAPIFFFDNNPVGKCVCIANHAFWWIVYLSLLGKVLNRFSKDIGYMDDQLQIFYTLTLMVIKYNTYL